VSERYLNAREVAELLGVSTETVLRWTRGREMPGVHLPGGIIRYRPDELEAWIEGRSTDAADRGLSGTRADRARREAGYPGDALSFAASGTRPLEAAKTEEDRDAR
jgi:excisionase family DNA binding protein